MSGLLNYLMSAADSSKRKLRSLFDDPMGSLQMSADDNIKAFTGSVQNKLNPTQQSNLTWGQPELNPADYLAGGVGKIVWHGSPHKFDKFDISKIGTGEGAQAYGHGLYMADAQDVARGYQMALTQKAGEETLIGGKPINDLYSKIQNKANNTPYPQARDMYDQASLLESMMLDTPPDQLVKYAQDVGMSDNVVNWMKNVVAPKTTIPGALYKVDIPDEAVARFLDWDKPLSQQADAIKPILRNMLNDAYGDGAAFNASGIGDSAKDYLMNQSGATAADVIKNLSRRYGDDVASQMLKKQGIPGIQYLDGGSRGLGEGTSNYVLFDDQLARILERNGQSTGLNPWNPGEWRGLLNE